MSVYPPEPWHLRGQMYGALWRLPRSQVPGPLPAGVRPLITAGTAWVATAWVDYQEGGVLAYRELLAAVLGRVGAVPTVTITRIWVDDPRSLAGGRELWGIPKQLARFDIDHDSGLTAAAYECGDVGGDVGGDELARGEFRPAVTLPGRVPLRATFVQQHPGGRRRTRATMVARLQLGRATLRVRRSSPLAFVAGARPVAGFAARDFRLVFGG